MHFITIENVWGQDSVACLQARHNIIYRSGAK